MKYFYNWINKDLHFSTLYLIFIIWYSQGITLAKKKSLLTYAARFDELKDSLSRVSYHVLKLKADNSSLPDKLVIWKEKFKSPKLNQPI